jgi:hypothetical protein
VQFSYLIFAFTFTILMLLTSCGESPEKYKQRALAVCDSITEYSDLSFAVASLRSEKWHSAIFSSYSTDFNQAIADFDKDNVLIIGKLQDKKKMIDSLYKTIKDYPDKSKEFYETVKDYYNTFVQAFQLGISGEGNYNSYTSEINELFSKYKNLKNTVELEKK